MTPAGGPEERHTPDSLRLSFSGPTLTLSAPEGAPLRDPVCIGGSDPPEDPMPPTELVTEELEEELREVDARLDHIQAHAELEGARDELQELVGLLIAREHARQKCDELKPPTVAHLRNIDSAEDEAIRAMLELEARIDCFCDRYGEWDENRERRLTVQVGQAEAMLRLWSARARPRKPLLAAERRKALADLDRRIAQARRLAAEHDRDPDNRPVRDAFEDATRLLEQAFLNAVRRFET